MMYIEFDTEAKAEKISRLLYSLFSPERVSTVYLFGWITHPTNGKAVGQVNELSSEPVHIKSDFDTVLDEIGLELAQNSNQTELTQLGQYIHNNSRVVIENLIPQYYKDNQLTFQDLYTLGYLEQP